MLSAVFPVVRLPYDQPDRVARILDTVRCELKASGQRFAAAVAAPTTTVTFLEPSSQWSSATMTVQVQQLHQQAKEPEKMTVAESTTLAAGDVTNSVAVNQTVDQVTVGVRDCTLTPKVKPEILVTTGAQPARNHYLGEQHSVSSAVQCDRGRPYLLVPPVNITSEISRPPPTALH